MPRFFIDGRVWHDIYCINNSDMNPKTGGIAAQALYYKKGNA